jgi:hypothetical protein
MPLCSNCSNPVHAKDKYCPYCDAPVEIKYSPTVDTNDYAVDTNDYAVAASDRISVLVKRYKDAYLVAKVTDGFGGLIKGVGITGGTVLVIIGIFVITADKPYAPTFALGIMILIAGVIAGLLFYIIGVLVSANAQVLKASLDSAVNSSPFLTNEHRAKIMSLPDA